MGKMPVKTGIIGMGYMGTKHVEAVRRINFSQIVARAILIMSL